MTDQIFYEELRAAIRDAVASYLDLYTDEELRELATESLSLPPRPTLADMTPEERDECRWMQCDAGSYGRRGLIIGTGEWAVYVADKETGTYSNHSPDLVTARPDLPRFEWPDTEKVEDETQAKVGDVIESADDPRIDALPVGSILLGRDKEATTKRRWAWTGAGYVPIAGDGTEYGPWKVINIGQEETK